MRTNDDNVKGDEWNIYYHLENNVGHKYVRDPSIAFIMEFINCILEVFT